MHEHDTPAPVGYPTNEELEQGLRRAHHALDELERTRWRVGRAIEAGIAPSWQEIGMSPSPRRTGG